MLASGCVPSPERQVLTRFFNDSRLYDTAALSKTATVVFNPRVDGVVQDFEIAETTAAAPDDASKELLVLAQVRTPGGRMERQQLRVRMERRDGKWLVTAVKPLPASQTSPAASSAPPR